MMKNELYSVVRTEETKLGRFCITKDFIEKEEKIFPYSFVHINQSVSILPFVNEHLLLIKQYRHSLKQWIYEIPGGEIDAGESPSAAAKREMEEETGYKIMELIDLGYYYPSPGSSDEKVYLFAAQCIKGEHGAKTEPLEYIECEFVTIMKFRQMLVNNQFMHGMGLVAWVKYCEKKGDRNACGVYKT